MLTTNHKNMEFKSEELVYLNKFKIVTKMFDLTIEQIKQEIEIRKTWIAINDRKIEKMRASKEEVLSEKLLKLSLNDLVSKNEYIKIQMKKFQFVLKTKDKGKTKLEQLMEFCEDKEVFELAIKKYIANLNTDIAVPFIKELAQDHFYNLRKMTIK
jgi:hypothetical protein